MKTYQSKYTGEQVDELLDQVSGETGISFSFSSIYDIKGEDINVNDLLSCFTGITENDLYSLKFLQHGIVDQNQDGNIIFHCTGYYSNSAAICCSCSYYRVDEILAGGVTYSDYQFFEICYDKETGLFSVRAGLM